MRPLPSSQGSKLRYQAACLWPYLSFEERVNLVEELDRHHDNIKKLLRLQLSPFSEEFLSAASKKKDDTVIVQQGTDILKTLYKSSNDHIKVRALVGLCELAEDEAANR